MPLWAHFLSNSAEQVRKDLERLEHLVEVVELELSDAQKRGAWNPIDRSQTTAKSVEEAKESIQDFRKRFEDPKKKTTAAADKIELKHIEKLLKRTSKSISNTMMIRVEVRLGRNDSGIFSLFKSWSRKSTSSSSSPLSTISEGLDLLPSESPSTLFGPLHMPPDDMQPEDKLPDDNLLDDTFDDTISVRGPRRKRLNGSVVDKASSDDDSDDDSAA